MDQSFGVEVLQPAQHLDGVVLRLLYAEAGRAPLQHRPRTMSTHDAHDAVITVTREVQIHSRGSVG